MNTTRTTLILTLALTIAISGCTPRITGSADGSRHMLYSSIADLGADSALIIVGSAEGRADSGTKDDRAETGTVVVVSEVLGGTSSDVPRPGDSVTVWQLGDSKTIGPAPLLSSGTTYLLFLTATGLLERGDSEFYVTGGTAGLWLPSDAGGSYKRSGDEGDSLPATLTADEVQALSK